MRRVDIHRSRLAFAASAAFLLVAGCGGESPTSLAGTETPPNGGNPGDSTSTGNPQSPYECERKGYPCALTGVPIAILERSDALGDSVVTMLVDGTSAADVVGWLQARPEMAEVQSDDGAIRFRLDGGRGTWIMLEGDEVDGDAAAPSAVIPRQPVPSRDNSVVGEGLDKKRALVLSPFLWSFGGYDEGPAVQAILENTRGYGSGVTFKGNATAMDRTVDVASFKGWGAYQVVHVTSHGKRVCDGTGCRAMVVINTVEALAGGGTQTPAEVAHALAEEGLDVSKSKHKPGATYIAATALFFRKTYPSGLDNTVVVFNACQTFGSAATDLVDAIQGNSSVVFGWDEAVYASEAQAAAIALFTELSEGGYRAEIAYDRLEDLKTGSATSYGPAPTLILGKRPTGGDLRIRDIVTLLDPATEQELTASSVVPIDGTKNDGEPDGAPWLVRVDGMKPEEAEKASLHVTIDGVDAEPVMVSSGTANENDQWTVGGTLPLGYDLEDTKTATFQAWVELPDGGKTDHEVAATLSGDEPLMGTTWELDATHTTSYTGIPNTPYTSTTHLILTFEPGQDPSEPNPRYVVTGGTVTFNWTHTLGDCSYIAPSITFDVTDEIANNSVLIFDTTTYPATYRGFMSTVGPDVEVAETCGIDGETHSRSQRATNTWMYVEPGDEQPVAADNRSITGTYRREQVFTTQTFIQESKYRIERIR